jgi:hypothetical protein
MQSTTVLDWNSILEDEIPLGSFEGLTFMSPIGGDIVPSERFEIITSGSTDGEHDAHVGHDGEPETFWPVWHEGVPTTEAQHRAQAWGNFTDFTGDAWNKHFANVAIAERMHFEGVANFDEFTFAARAAAMRELAAKLRSSAMFSSPEKSQGMKRSRSCADLPSLESEDGPIIPDAPRKVNVAVRRGINNQRPHVRRNLFGDQREP